MINYITWWVQHWYSRVYGLRWVIFPAALAAFIVPEDGNMLLYLMVFSLAWISAICSMAELQRQDKEHAREEKDQEES